MSKEVLVVDDDPDLAEVMLLLLKRAGYATRSARNGKEALEEVARRRPDVVLLDVLMPVMDGLRCARELRARYGSRIPIVVVTAAEHARARAREIEVEAVLAKPFDVDDLLSVVERSTIGSETRGR